MKYTITDALRSTNESFYISNDDYENLDWKSSEPKPTKEWCENKAKEMQEEWDAQEYSRKRKAEYDALNQLELISDDDVNGTTTHKDAIAVIKAKWPKDNSGPV